MSLVKSILAELLSLFVDDGNLALQIVGLIFVVTAMTKLAHVGPLISAAVLLIGCIAILIASVIRRARS